MAFHLRRDIWLRCPSLIFRQRGSREYNEDKGVCIGASPCCGSSHITPTKMTSFLDTLAERGIKADFAPGFTLDLEPADPALESEAVETAKNADVVLMFLGLPEAAESEGFDRDTLDMPAKQITLLEQVAAANQNVVVVLSNGSVITVAPWAKNAKGILESWLLGQSGGPALADVIFGKVSPSGKLAQSIPLDINDDPSMLNWPGEEGHVDYGEGVFVGYRYYDTYGKAVDYPFGYGLSYATFEITGVAVAKAGANTATVNATVTNTSDVDAAETVQVYVAPGKADVARPKHELKGFTKVFLKSGESKTRDHRPRRARVRLLVRKVQRLARGGRRICHRSGRELPRHCRHRCRGPRWRRQDPAAHRMVHLRRVGGRSVRRQDRGRRGRRRRGRRAAEASG